MSIYLFIFNIYLEHRCYFIKIKISYENQISTCFLDSPVVLNIMCQGVKQVKFEAMSQKYLLMGLIDKIKEVSNSGDFRTAHKWQLSPTFTAVLCVTTRLLQLSFAIAYLSLWWHVRLPRPEVDYSPQLDIALIISESKFSWCNKAQSVAMAMTSILQDELLCSQVSHC